MACMASRPLDALWGHPCMACTISFLFCGEAMGGYAGPDAGVDAVVDPEEGLHQSQLGFQHKLGNQGLGHIRYSSKCEGPAFLWYIS